MMSSMRFASLVVFLLAASMPGQQLTAKTFAKWKRYILPTAKQLEWRLIPWRHEFRIALREANEQHKPVLLWAMNGHPLGCT